jgi:hypothetical protein
MIILASFFMFMFNSFARQLRLESKRLGLWALFCLILEDANIMQDKIEASINADEGVFLFFTFPFSASFARVCSYNKRGKKRVCLWITG